MSRPSREERAPLLLAVLLAAVGGLAWWLALREPLRVDASSLARFPAQLEGWSASELPVDAAAEEMLAADWNLHRLYSNASGEILWLYVGYYGTERGGRPEHTPDACYRAHGWTTRDERSVAVPRARGLRVNEMLVEASTGRQLVHFWFRSARSTGQLGWRDQAVDRFLARLLTGRADGAVVRISTPVEEKREIESARSRLLAFAAAADAALDPIWPIEVPEGSERR